MKLMKNRRIYYIILPLLFLFTVCTDVYARELELGERTEGETQKDIGYFNVSASKTWTSRGREILSYDVSQNGSILITFPDRNLRDPVMRGRVYRVSDTDGIGRR